MEFAFGSRHPIPTIAIGSLLRSGGVTIVRGNEMVSIILGGASFVEEAMSKVSSSQGSVEGVSITFLTVF